MSDLRMQFLPPHEVACSHECYTSKGWLVWFMERYGWTGLRDLGDSKRMGTPTWKALLATLLRFCDCIIYVVADGWCPTFWPRRDTLEV